MNRYGFFSLSLMYYQLSIITIFPQMFNLELVERKRPLKERISHEWIIF